MSKKNVGLKKHRLFVMSAYIYNTTTISSLRKILLSLDIDLPSTVIWFGSSDDNEITFLCHFDSCTDMNTGNSPLHMWIMTTYPKFVASYKRYDNNKSFQTIILECAVPLSAAEKDDSKLSVVVTYKKNIQIRTERWYCYRLV